MKHRMIALSLAMALLLSGCALVRGEYSSVKPHTEAYSQSQTAKTQTVKNQQELEAAVTSFILEGVQKAEVTGSAYDGDFAADYEALIDRLLTTEPDAAYMVESISKRIVSVEPYYKLSLLICYRHTPAQVAEAKAVVTGDDPEVTDSAAAALANAMEQGTTELLLRFSDYRPTDFEKIAQAYFEKHLLTVMACPIIKAQSFPQTGKNRLVALTLTYPGLEGKPSFEGMQSSVDTIMSSAEGYVKDSLTEMGKATLLYSFLAERFDYQIDASRTPVYDMLFSGIADSRTFSAVYCAMCTRAGLTCYEVHGEKNGEPYHWNILELSSGTWHVDALSDEQSGRDLQFLTDDLMMNYQWSGDYPVCSGSPEPVTPTVTEPEELPEEPEENLPEEEINP